MRIAFVFFTISLLVGCAMGHQDPTEIKAALAQAHQANDPLATLPDAVQTDLMPGLQDSEKTSGLEMQRRFKIDARNLEAKTFFTSLVQGSPYSVVLHPDVRGRITLAVNDVTIDEVLGVVSDIYGYQVERRGNIIQIFPAGMRTQTFPIDYLQLKRVGRSLTAITTGSVTNRDEGNNDNSSSDNNSWNGNSGDNNYTDTSSVVGGTVIETSSESDFWPQLERAVMAMIGGGEGRSVTASPQASLLTVRAYPDELRQVQSFLNETQLRLKRQVILEAKILEVTLSDSYQQGINWSKLTSSIGSVGITISQPAGSGKLPSISPIGDLLGGQTNITIGDGNFETVLSFMSTQGDLNVLSSPRVTAANNQKAVIKVGQDEYFVTDISSVAGSGDSANVAPEVELTPFFSGISLDVTPQIDNKGGVMLHVHPAVIDVTSEEKNIALGQFGDLTVPLAKSSIRESDSIIHAKSGDVVVIGGLMKSELVDQVSKVPGLGDIPAIGHLFRNVAKVKRKTELVILLKPTVVEDDSWQQEIQRSQDLLNQWFPEEAK